MTDSIIEIRWIRLHAAIGILCIMSIFLPLRTHADPGSVACSGSVAGLLNTIEAADSSEDAKSTAEKNAKAACKGVKATRGALISVPQSPAFAVLNVTPDDVVSPTSPDEFAVDVLRTVDPNGNFQSGLAMDFIPFLAFAGDDVTLADYAANRAVRVLSNTQLSIATTKGEDSEDESTQLAIGLSVTPWMEIDPKLDKKHLNCLGEAGLDALDAALEKYDPETQKELYDAFLVAETKRLAGSCRERFAAREPENGGALRFGVAPKWLSKDGDLDDLEYNGLSAWGSFAVNLGGSDNDIPLLGAFGRGIISARYTTDEEVIDLLNQGSFIEQDTLSVTGKLEFTGPEGKPGDNVQDMRFSAGLTYINTDPENRDSDDYYRYNAELKMRLPNVAENLWLVATLGQTSDRDGGDETFVGTSLKWAFNDPGK